MSTATSPDNATASVSKATEPSSPSVELTPPRSSSFSTPGNAFHDQTSSKFKLFNGTGTPVQRSTNALNQNISTAPPFLRDPNELHASIPAGLVDINLALGALDLDFGGARPAVATDDRSLTNTQTSAPEKEAADMSSSSITETDDGSALIEADDNHHHPFGPGLMHQPMHPFFPMNEFGQPLHAGFSPSEQMGGAQPVMNHPWPAKPGQPPFGPGMGGNVGMENMSHTPPIPPPGMMPMRPFEFHSDGMAPPHMGQQGPMSPHDGSFNGMSPFGQMKDASGNFAHSPNFGPIDQGFGQQPHPLQNTQMWPPLNGRPQHMDQGYGNGMVPNSGNNDRRYPYYQNGNNNNNNLHHHHHHHHHHNNNNNNGNGNHHSSRRMMNNRRRGEDAARFANAKLEDFVGQIYSLCKDQHGCRFLQKQLDLDATNATPIFEETQMHVVELMIDPFGNYLVQKLLEKVNDEQRVTLVKNAAPEFITVALDPHGTRALQKLVECIDSDEEAEVVVSSLKNDIVLLSRDLNGNHVVQKCLQRLKTEDAQFIFDTASEHCSEIATHRHGCCVLQRCLDHGSEEQRKSLAAIISENTGKLSVDAFGNYVVQYVMTKNCSEATGKIVEVVKSDLIELALHKFGSNVIEKCLRTTEHSSDLIEELLKNEDEMLKLLNDPYGNYVIQTCLDVAKEDQFEKLSNLLKPLLPQVRNTPHGRRILARLQPGGKPFNPHHHHHHSHHSSNGNHQSHHNNRGSEPIPTPVLSAETAPQPVSTSN